MRGILLLLVFLLSASAAFAQSPTPPQASPMPARPVPLWSYRELVRDYERASKRPLTPAEAKAFQDRFSATRIVTLPGGGSVTVNNQAEIDALSPLLKGGGRPRPLGGDAQARVVLLRQLVEPQGAPGRAPAGDPRAVANAVLAADEFREAASPKGDGTLWDKIVKGARWLSGKIADFLDWLFGRRTRGAGTAIPGLAEAVRFILFFLAAVGVLVGVVYLARFLVANGPRWLARRRGAAGGSGLDLSADDLPDALGAARERADAGDFRGAVRLAYIACLRRLAGVGLVVLQENRTNWEYQRALRGRSKAAYDAVLPATRLFDVVWYGNRAATREAFDVLLKAHDTLPQTPPEPQKAEPAAATGKPAPTKSKPNGGNPW